MVLNQVLKKTVDLLNRLQSSINETNKIFPINDEDKLPKVPQNFFKFLNENFFPQLHPKGLNITESIVEIFNQYNLKKIQLKDFNLELVKKNDIVIKDKIRYSFEIKMDFEVDYEGGNNTVNLQFDLKAQTSNFLNLQELQNSFNGNDLNTQLFWKPLINKLVDKNQNDLTSIAKTAVSDSLFLSNTNIFNSVLKIDEQLDLAKTKFEKEIIEPFKKEREKAKADYEEQQRILAEERRKQEEELKRKEEEAKRLKEQQEQFNKSFENAKEFKDYWKNQKKDVTDKTQLIDALKTSFAADKNKTFSLLINSFTKATSDYYKNNKKDESENAKKAFSEKGIQFPRQELEGLYMSDWLRGKLTSYTDIKLNLTSIKIENKENNPTIDWKNNGIEFRQHYPYKFKFEIDIKYQGGYKLTGLFSWFAPFSGIPSSWNGEMDVKFIVDGDLDYNLVQNTDYPGSLFQFKDNQLLFTLHVKEQIKVQDGKFMDLLKQQNLHNLDLRNGATKPPVVDLASYLHYLVLNS